MKKFKREFRIWLFDLPSMKDTFSGQMKNAGTFLLKGMIWMIIWIGTIGRPKARKAWLDCTTVFQS